MKKSFWLIIIIGIFIVLILYIQNKFSNTTDDLPVVETEIVASSTTSDQTNDQPNGESTETYSAQVDRVKVIFSQWDYTRYRLQTNDLVREGELNTERGYNDDPDATVYVLNWQAPVGEQIRYVRLTAEPGYLYALDGYQNIIKSGRLLLEEK